MAQTKKTQYKTTERGGVARLIAGSVLLVLGLGWALALLMSTVSAWSMLRLLRDTAHGLGGVLCPLLPVFAMAGGVLLCASARRRVSMRAYFAMLGIYLCLLAMITLMTSVSSRDTSLMDYIANNNRAALGMVDNTSYSAYLTGAYHLRGFNGGHLAGGGLLGMLLAYPVYRFLNIVGGATMLTLAILALALVAFRINPAEIIGIWAEKRYQRRVARAMQREQQETAQPEQKPATCQPPPVEPLIRGQNVNYTTTSVQTDPTPSYLVPEEEVPPVPAEGPAARGFVPVESGELYQEYIPVGDEAKLPSRQEKRRARRSRAEQEGQPPVQAETPLAEASPAAVAEEKLQEDVPWYTDAEMPAPEALAEQPVRQEEAPVREAEKAPATRISSGGHTSGEVRQVYTDPAVPLTGERIPISQSASAPAQPDPLAVKHTAAAIRAVKGEYAFPPMEMLHESSHEKIDTTQEDRERAATLEHTLASFNVEARVEYVVHGPAITRFALRLADGVNVNRINNIANNLSMNMKAVGLRIEIPIPGTSLVGIEVPNQKVSKVTLRDVLDSPVMRANPSPTAVAIGKDITGTPIMCELSEMPHMLIAGATGSGKSVCINSIIQSILYRATPRQVRMIMIDPKLVELQPYNGIPHLLTEVVSDPKKAAAALDWAVQEMGDRYRRFQQVGARNIGGYNQKMKNEDDRMPQIVLIIDEFSDLMVQCRKSVEESIQRLAALARAAGIYMIVATQRPSVDVITGVIKANIPSRIAFAVANNVDSRTIIDSVGAEKLLGRGDMLYFPKSEFRPLRVQGCFVTDDEVQRIADYIKENNDALYDERIDEHMERATAEAEQQANGKEKDPEFQTNTENEMLQRAIEMAVESGQMSISMLRRRLGLGHSRAGKLLDTMADMGIVSQDEGPKPRRTLITREDYIKMQAQILDE